MGRAGEEPSASTLQAWGSESPTSPSWPPAAKAPFQPSAEHSWGIPFAAIRARRGVGCGVTILPKAQPLPRSEDMARVLLLLLVPWHSHPSQFKR